MPKSSAISKLLKFLHIKHKIGKSAITTYLLLSYIIVVATIFYFANRSFEFFLETKTMKMQSAAYEIESDFSQILTDVEAMLSGVNRKIMLSSGDKKQINSILQRSAESNYNKYDLQNILADGTFFWIDSKRKLVMSKAYGVLKVPVKVSGCEYLANTENIPWQIFIGEPTIGAASGQYVLPVGVGVNNAKGYYIGTLAAGIKVDNLVERLSKLSSVNQFDFAIINDKSRILLESKPELFSSDRKLMRALNNLTQASEARVVLDYSALSPQRKYVIAHGFEKYPYTVLISVSNDEITSEVMAVELMPHLIELLIITIFFGTTLFFIRTVLKK